MMRGGERKLPPDRPEVLLAVAQEGQDEEVVLALGWVTWEWAAKEVYGALHAPLDARPAG